MKKVVTIAARRYIRLCWWADREDLEQEGWVSALRTLTSWRANRGRLNPYLATGVYRDLQPYLLRQSSVVSCRSNDDVGSLARILRAPVSAIPETGTPVSGELELDRKRVAAYVQELLAGLVERDPSLLPGARVFLEDLSPDEVAEAAGIPVRAVYKSRTRLKQILEMDETLWLLWKEG